MRRIAVFLFSIVAPVLYSGVVYADCVGTGSPATSTTSLNCSDDVSLIGWSKTVFSTDALSTLLGRAVQDYDGGHGLIQPSYSVSQAFTYNSVENLAAYFYVYTQGVEDGILRYYTNLNVVYADATADPYVKDYDVSKQSYRIAPVPGPEAGVGLGALAIAGAAAWLQRYRRSDRRAVQS